MKIIPSILLILILVSCNTSKKQDNSLPLPEETFTSTKKDNKFPNSEIENTKIKYAEGFTITNYGNYKLLEINNALPKQDKAHRYVLLTKEQSMVATFNRSEYDGIITVPIERIAANYKEHLDILKALNVSHSIIENNGSKNPKELLENKPNLIVTPGINGIDNKLENLRKANISLIYTGGWNEKSKLAKAEWIKFFAALYMKENDANSIFKTY